MSEPAATTSPEDELAALKKEYATFQAKTKDWQNKVRDRDNMMKTRIAESTAVIKEKDKTLEQQAVEIRQLSADKNALQEQVTSLEQRLITQEETIADLKTSLSKAHDASEELQRRHDEVQKLRQRIASLEELNTKLKDSAEGNDLFSGAGSNNNNVEVIARCDDVGAGLWICAKQRTSGKVTWVEQDKFLAMASAVGDSTSAISFPPTERERYSQHFNVTFKSQYRVLSDAFDSIQTIYVAEHAEMVRILWTLATQTHRVLRHSVDSIRSQCEERVQHLRSNQLQESTRQVRAETDALKAELAQVVTELTDVKKEFSAYRTKAQAALKASGIPRAESQGSMCSTSAEKTEKAAMRSHGTQTFDLAVVSMPMATQTELTGESLRGELAEAKRLIRRLEAEHSHNKHSAEAVNAKRISVSTTVSSGAQTEVSGDLPSTSFEDGPPASTPQQQQRERRDRLPSTSSAKYLFSMSRATISDDDHQNEERPSAGVSPSSSAFDFTALLYANQSAGNSGGGGGVLRTESSSDIHSPVMATTQGAGGAPTPSAGPASLRNEVESSARKITALETAMRETNILYQETLSELQNARDEVRLLRGTSDLNGAPEESQAYKKNVMLRFLMSKDNVDVQRDLIPVVSTLLQLTPDEMKQVTDCYRTGFY
eukprot:PhM_4_TR18779/c0_g1_i1/m.58803